MTLQPWLLEILACPCEQHAPLGYDPDAADGAGELACTVCDRVFRIEDGIPVLLLDEAEHRGEASHRDGTGHPGGTGHRDGTGHPGRTGHGDEA